MEDSFFLRQLRRRLHDGSQKWNGAPGGKTYGIRMTVTEPHVADCISQIRGLSRFVTIRNVEDRREMAGADSEGAGSA